MFELYYRVVHSEYDDFVGQNGFFQIKCNECKYGEIYPKELETVESYNTWIEFRKTNEEVMVSIVKAEKEEGSHDIEFNLKEPIAGEWEKQVIRYSQLKTEIIEKLAEYVEFITISNTEHPEIEKIDELLKGFQKCDF